MPKVGDELKQFDKLCEVQSDKANIEITSRYSGRVIVLHHEPGAVVKVGAPLLDLEVPEEELTGEAAAAHAAQSPSSQGPPTVPAPAAQAAVAAVATAQVIDAAASAAPSQQLPPAPKPAAPPLSAAAPTGSAFVPTTVVGTAGHHAGAAPAGSGGGAGAVVHASPAVRTLAKSLGIDIAAVRGTGPGGRVTREDVVVYQQAAAAPSAAGRAADARPHAAPAPHHTQRPLADVVTEYQALTATSQQQQQEAEAGAQASSSVPIKGYRRAMMKSMTAAAAIPHFHFCEELVVDKLLQLRGALKDDPALKGQRLTHLPFLLKALSLALSAHPHINASLAPGGQELLVHKAHNIGIAMATPLGLVVPNIKQVQGKSVAQIARELSLLQLLAAAGKLPTEALTGGTISVSNIGTIGGTYATPLVNPPEVAIVALGRIQQLPRYPAATATATSSSASHHQPYQQHSPVPTSVLPTSWGADHRVVDGAALAALSNTWKAFVEEPGRLLLHLS